MEVQVAVADRKQMSVHFVQVKSLRLGGRARKFLPLRSVK